ncbi:hypothetical protein OH76DRAFT_272893 [Lentinus brumalis]|uniref:Uncharacterized protein n=1 Tax=Lentinus brumalis TaxID=2498619 RepID=A0A371DH05_9APHY|nr:hypothetical protein OH76DRAFT_272893 [Polyporus brumalis]
MVWIATGLWIERRGDVVKAVRFGFYIFVFVLRGMVVLDLMHLSQELLHHTVMENTESSYCHPGRVPCGDRRRVQRRASELSIQLRNLQSTDDRERLCLGSKRLESRWRCNLRPCNSSVLSDLTHTRHSLHRHVGSTSGHLRSTMSHTADRCLGLLSRGVPAITSPFGRTST